MFEASMTAAAGFTNTSCIAFTRTSHMTVTNSSHGMVTIPSRRVQRRAHRFHEEP
jgi:hypothetical protein